jgi:hypothetical protein
MSPPHIVCYQNPFTMRYDGTQPHPVELCIRMGTAGWLVISEPAGATWPLPTTGLAGVVVAHGTRSGRTLVVSITAALRGTATLAVPGTSWRLKIAVV